MKKLDDKLYWRKRHAASKDLQASGVKSVSSKSNHYIYKMLAEQYKKLLEAIDLKNCKTVIDCGFGNGYFLDFFSEHYPGLEVYGVDISAAAKSKAKSAQNKRLFVADLTNLQLKRQFDIVHCFDVLYHILAEADYEKAIKNLCKISNKYVILHERFLRKSPLISSAHVQLRSADKTNKLLNDNGFFLYEEIPTHFLAMRLPIYRLNKFIPNLLYMIDAAIARTFKPPAQKFLGPHFIRVYKEADN